MTRDIKDNPEKPRIKPPFRLYFDGDVQFTDSRAQGAVSFAHVADLHLPLHPPEAWPEKYREAISWWDIRFGHPHRVLPGLLDDIRAREVDFVFFGGDILDYYHPETARLLARMCRERGLTAYFQIGNHDCEDEHTRFATHKCDLAARSQRARELICEDWKMPGLYYLFDFKGVRFIVLDTPYIKVDPDWIGIIDSDQADWFVSALEYDGPIVVFHHVPFNRPTLEYRLLAVWNGVLGCVAEDDNGRRVISAIEGCRNILGTFTGHSHFRSEDKFGHTCQFMAPPGHYGEWRYVKIAGTVPPKSLFVPGEPVAGAEGG